jgi:hypothetical protein
MRYFLQFLVLGLSSLVGGIGCIAAGIWAGTASDNFFVGFGAAIFVAAIVLVPAVLIFNRLINFGRTKMDSWLSTVASFDFKYAFDGTGIAVLKSKQVVCLAQKVNGRVLSKEYPFTDIRSWETEIAGQAFVAGPTYKQQVGVHMFNQVQAEKTGLSLSVKDVEFPNWFIKFGNNIALGKNTKRELDRWMEILRQTVNE